MNQNRFLYEISMVVPKKKYRKKGKFWVGLAYLGSAVSNATEHV
jgi:hypothetical protein